MPRSVDSSKYLYRIVRFDRLVQMLESDMWHFSHPSAWEDPYETRVKNSLSDALFAQCWCRTGVSDAMWRIYSPDRLGVRIRTTREKLITGLLASTKRQDLGFQVSDVKYVNELQHAVRAAAIEVAMAKGATFLRASAHLLLKRRAFSHEAETRIVIFDPSRANDLNPQGVKIEMNTRRVIDSVLVDPRAPNEFVDAYRHYLTDRIKFAGPVKKSGLYATGQTRES